MPVYDYAEDFAVPSNKSIGIFLRYDASLHKGSIHTWGNSSLTFLTKKLVGKTFNHCKLATKAIVCYSLCELVQWKTGFDETLSP